MEVKTGYKTFTFTRDNPTLLDNFAPCTWIVCVDDLNKSLL